ncbi:cystathionine beta-lyase [Streptococcus rifensis]
MTDYLKLAMAHGGFTSLDKVYLKKALADKSHAEKLQFITPPPSVLNAYFAEIYDKQGPQAATNYYWELSRALGLFPTNPSFAEEYPFVRLNLGGKAYGFAYLSSASEKAQVFAEQAEPMTESLLIQLAQLFPHYQVFEEGGQIWMTLVEEADIDWVYQDGASSLLTDIWIAEKAVKLSGFNTEDLLQIAQNYQGMRRYQFTENQLTLLITN